MMHGRGKSDEAIVAVKRNGNLEAVGITTCHVVDRWPRRPDSAYEFCLVAMAWNARRETQKVRA
jgi:hypothetical protein